MIGELPAVLAHDEKGEVTLAPERFKDAGELRQVCQQMIEADKPRSRERANVDGQANGNPCYSLSKLRAKNQGWRARTNYRGLEGKLSELGNIFYDMNSEVDPLIRVFMDYGGSEQQQNDWCEKIAKEYSRMLLSQWAGFDYHIPMRDTTMLRHGLGVHVWTVKNKWEPRTPAAGHVLFPENTSVDFHTEGESFMIREFVPSHILYGFIRNEDAATKLGWDVKAVWETLANTSKASTDESKPEEYQSKMRNGDYGTSMTKRSGVWVNKFFIIELETRKISQYIISESESEGSGKYLFKKRNMFDSWEDVIVLFPYEIPSNGMIHGIRGFGARSFEHFRMLDRTTNSMVDRVAIESYPMLKELTTIDPDKKKLVRIGAFNWLPQGSEIQTMNFANMGQSGIPLIQLLNASIKENNQTYLTGAPEPKDRETALSFQMRAQDSSRVSKATHSLYYRNVTRFHKKVLLTALKGGSGNEPWAVMGREMRQRILAQDVPEEALNRISDVEAMRSVGAGSAAQRMNTMMTLWQTIYPTTTEDRKIAIERDLTSAVAGYAQVDRYARHWDDNDIPDQDDTIAALENSAMRQGDEAVANSQQDDVKHAGSHLQDAAEVVQAWQEGAMPPDQALAVIQRIGRHVAQHLQRLQGNPARKAEYDQLVRDLMALSQIADQLQQEVEAAAETPPPEQQVSEDYEIGMAKVQADTAVKQEKMLRDEARKDYQAQANTQRQFAQAAAQTRLNAAKAAADARTKRLALTQGPKRKAA